MEMFSNEFVKTVKNLLHNSNLKILATVPACRGKSISVVEKLKNSPKNYVMTVCTI